MRNIMENIGSFFDDEIFRLQTAAGDGGMLIKIQADYTLLRRTAQRGQVSGQAEGQLQNAEYGTDGADERFPDLLCKYRTQTFVTL